MADQYSRSYTESINSARSLAAWAASRILLDHLVDTEGAVVYQEGGKVMPTEFRKKLVAYFDDRGCLQHDGPERSLVGDEVRAIAAAGIPAVGPAEESLSQCAKMFVEVAGDILKGKDGLMAMASRFSPRVTYAVWEDLMVHSTPKAPCTELLSRSLVQLLAEGRPLVIFEGGAGVGSVLRRSLAKPEFGELSAGIEQYLFSDISPSLMKRARSWLGENASPDLVSRIQFRSLNLDTLHLHGSAPFATASVDFALFDHVLYDVRDLQAALKQIHRMLKPGGWLGFTMSYRQRPAVFHSCEFLQSSLWSYYRAKLDPPRRNQHGYLTLDEWRLSLRDAGFMEFDVYPNPADLEAWPHGGIIARKA